MKHLILCILLGLFSLAADAQPRRTVPSHRPDPTLDFLGAGALTGPIVRGAPYSGEGVTTVTQVLGDGTRIERIIRAKFYRDRDGRVRREQTIIGLAALDPSLDSQAVLTIADPIAGVTYVLDPTTHTGRRMPLRLDSQRGPDGAPPPPPPPPPPSGTTAAGAPPAPPPPPVPESLGTRQIEGVRSTGRKTTITIPAGQIGNNRPIEITDERWESPELKVLVLSRHHDPRTGDIEYRLTNVNRSEPAHDLFTVPSGYMIVDAPPLPPPPPPPPR
jgi:hypothetical protein